jgi:hypothetical protein
VSDYDSTYSDAEGGEQKMVGHLHNLSFVDKQLFRYSNNGRIIMMSIPYLLAKCNHKIKYVRYDISSQESLYNLCTDKDGKDKPFFASFWRPDKPLQGHHCIVVDGITEIDDVEYRFNIRNPHNIAFSVDRNDFWEIFDHEAVLPFILSLQRMMEC